MSLVAQGKAAVQKCLHRVGLDLVRFLSEDDILRRRMRLLKRHDVTLVFDVGAHIGRYAETLRALGYPGRLVSFEPLTDAFRKLEAASRADDRWDVVNLALGPVEGTSTMHVARNGQSSSLLPMLPAHLHAAPESEELCLQPVQVSTLDSMIEKYAHEDDKLFVKLDVQGYEMHVLEGAAESLDRITGFQLELSLIPLYEGGCLIEEVVGRLREIGFVPMSFELGFADEARDQLVQVDGLFFRQSEARSIVQ